MSFLIYGIMKKHEAGKSPIILITGELGNGKTMAGIGIARSIHKKIHGTADWDMKGNIFHDVRTFVRKMFTAESQILLFDEAGVTLNAKEFWSKFNTAFYKVIQTQRFKNNIYIIILPIAMSLARDHRRMIDFKLEMVKKRYAKVWLVKKKWSAMKGDELQDIWIGHIQLPLIPKKIVKAYKKIEIREKGLILDDIAKSLNIEKPKTLWELIEIWEKKILGIIMTPHDFQWNKFGERIYSSIV